MIMRKPKKWETGVTITHKKNNFEFCIYAKIDAKEIVFVDGKIANLEEFFNLIKERFNVGLEAFNESFTTILEEEN